MCTDASTLGLGAVLIQCDDRGKIHVMVYASRTPNSAETNYSIRHLETLALVWGLKHFFRYIILGYEVTVYTDHAAVAELFRCKKLNLKTCTMESYHKRFFTQVQIYTRTLKCSRRRVIT